LSILNKTTFKQWWRKRWCKRKNYLQRNEIHQ